MALPADAEVLARVGEKPMSPTFVDKLEHDGDDAYPAGGSPDYTAFVNSMLASKGDTSQRTIQDVIGFGYSAAGAITHFVRYDNAEDKLLVYARGNGEEVAPGDLSATLFRVTVFSS